MSHPAAAHAPAQSRDKVTSKRQGISRRSAAPAAAVPAAVGAHIDKTLDDIFIRMHIAQVVEIIATDEFAAWYADLDDQMAEDVAVSVDLLAIEGFRLGYPRSSAIEGASFALRELRIQSRGHPVRVFYAFDPVRNAVLTIGGDKTGDNRFYERMVPLAERVWKEYLDEIAQVE